jgi:hypothetical protein
MAWRGRERYFNPARTAVTPAAKTFVSRAIEAAEVERRQANPNTRRLQNRHRQTFEATVEAIVLDLLYFGLIEKDQYRGIAVTRNISHLGRGDPNKPVAINSGLPKRLDELEAAGWINQAIGRRSASHGAVLTTILPGPQLIANAADLRLNVEHLGIRRSTPAIVIKDEGGNEVTAARKNELLHSAAGERIARDLERINAHLELADISLKSGKDWSPALPRDQHRTFMENSLERGGRFSGGFWYSMSKQERFERLRINGEPIALLDFNAMMTRTAYGLAGVQPSMEDPYLLPGLEAAHRDGIKTLLNAMFWDDWSEKPRRSLPRGTRQFFPRKLTYPAVADIVLRQHAPIADFLGRGKGGYLQFIESETINHIMVGSIDRDLVLLPIHDAVLVPVSQWREARQLMQEAFYKACGGEAVVDCELWYPIGKSATP